MRRRRERMSADDQTGVSSGVDTVIEETGIPEQMKRRSRRK